MDTLLTLDTWQIPPELEESFFTGVHLPEQVRAAEHTIREYLMQRGLPSEAAATAAHHFFLDVMAKLEQGILPLEALFQTRQETRIVYSGEAPVHVQLAEAVAQGRQVTTVLTNASGQAVDLGDPRTTALIGQLEKSLVTGVAFDQALAQATQAANQARGMEALRVGEKSPGAELMAALSGTGATSALSDLTRGESPEQLQAIQAGLEGALLQGGSSAQIVQAALAAGQHNLAVAKLAIGSLSPAEQLAAALSSGSHVTDMTEAMGLSPGAIGSLMAGLSSGQGMSTALAGAQSASQAESVLAVNQSLPLSSADQLAQALATGGISASPGNEALAQALATGSSMTTALEQAKQATDLHGQTTPTSSSPADLLLHALANGSPAAINSAGFSPHGVESYIEQVAQGASASTAAAAATAASDSAANLLAQSSHPVSANDLLAAALASGHEVGQALTNAGLSPGQDHGQALAALSTTPTTPDHTPGPTTTSGGETLAASTPGAASSPESAPTGEQGGAGSPQPSSTTTPPATSSSSGNPPAPPVEIPPPLSLADVTPTAPPPTEAPNPGASSGPPLTTTGEAPSGESPPTDQPTRINHKPVITAGATLAYTENGPAAAIDTTIEVSDPEDIRLAGATITLSGGFTPGDLLTMTPQRGISGHYDDGSGILILSGLASLVDYQTALRSVTFSSASDGPTALSASRTITWQVTDANGYGVGAQTSSGATSTITITPVGDTPQVASVTTPEDTQSGLLVLDRHPADGSEVTSFRISNITGGTLYLNDGMTAIAEGATIPYAEGQAGLKFTPTANSDGAGGFDVESSENGVTVAAQSGVAHSTITITPVGDTPQAASLTTLEDTQSDPIVLDRNTADGSEVSFFRISHIVGGLLYLNDGVTAIADGAYIAYADGHTGLKFTPTTDSTVTGGFDVESSENGVTVAAQSDAAHSTITITPVGDTPQVASIHTLEDHQSGAIILERNAADGSEVAFFKISHITGGTLYLNDGVTALVDATYISYADGQAGLKFTPITNSDGAGGFDVESSENGTSVAAQSSAAHSTITITPVGDTPQAASITTMEDTQSAPILLERNAADGNEVTFFKISHITGGTLYLNDGMTAIAEGDYIPYAEGHAGLKFTPTADSDVAGGFDVESSENGVTVAAQSDAAHSTITITPVGDTPQVASLATPEDIQSGAIVLERNPLDGGEVTSFRISNVTGGTLYLNDGVTAIADGAYISYADGHSGLKFTPALHSEVTGGFDVESSENGTSVAAQSAKAHSTITVTPPCSTGDPLVLDLDGDGVQLVAREVGPHFDMNQDGQVEQTGWVGPRDGLLALDGNGNGQIDSIRELISEYFAPGSSSSRQALATLDTDHNGQIDAADPAYSHLLVWQDANQDGISQPGELSPLKALGISAISLDFTSQTTTQEGNLLTGEARFVRQDGATGGIAEVHFSYIPQSPAQFFRDGPAPVALPVSVEEFCQMLDSPAGGGDHAMLLAPTGEAVAAPAHGVEESHASVVHG